MKVLTCRMGMPKLRPWSTASLNSNLIEPFALHGASSLVGHRSCAQHQSRGASCCQGVRAQNNACARSTLAEPSLSQVCLHTAPTDPCFTVSRDSA